MIKIQISQVLEPTQPKSQLKPNTSTSNQTINFNKNNISDNPFNVNSDNTTKEKDQKYLEQNTNKDYSKISQMKSDYADHDRKNNNCDIESNSQSKIDSKNQLGKKDQKRFIRGKKKQQGGGNSHDKYTGIKRRPVEQTKKYKKKLHESQETGMFNSTEIYKCQKIQFIARYNSIQKEDNPSECNQINIEKGYDEVVVLNDGDRSSWNPVSIQQAFIDSKISNNHQKYMINECMISNLQETEKRLNEENLMLREMLFQSCEQIQQMNQRLGKINDIYHKETKAQVKIYKDKIREMKSFIAKLTLENNELIEKNQIMVQKIEQQEKKSKKLQQYCILQVHQNKENQQLLNSFRVQLQNSSMQKKQLTINFQQIRSNFIQQEHNYEQMLRQLEWKHNQQREQLRQKMYMMEELNGQLESQIEKLIDQVSTLTGQLTQFKSNKAHQTEEILIDYDKAVQLKNVIQKKQNDYNKQINHWKKVNEEIYKQNMCLQQKLQNKLDRRLQFDGNQLKEIEQIFKQYDKKLEERDKQIKEYQLLILYENIYSQKIVSQADLLHNDNPQVIAVILIKKLFAKIKVLESDLLMCKEKQRNLNKQIHLLISFIKKYQKSQQEDLYIIINTLTDKLQQTYQIKQKMKFELEQLRIDKQKKIQQNQGRITERQHSLCSIGNQNAKLFTEIKKLNKVIRTLQEQIRLICKLNQCEAHWHIINRLENTIQGLNIQIRAQEQNKGQVKKHKPLSNI